MEDFILHEKIICDDKDPHGLTIKQRNYFANEIFCIRIIAQIMITQTFKNNNVFAEEVALGYGGIDPTSNYMFKVNIRNTRTRCET